MLFSNFIGDAIIGEDFVDRLGRYSGETNWSNGEVITRGTGTNFGEDGLVRPGYAYVEGMHYLRSKVIEYRETGQPLSDVLLRDWKQKFAAALVPRGLEHNAEFLPVLVNQLLHALMDSFITNAAADKSIGVDGLEAKLKARAEVMGELKQGEAGFWTQFLNGLELPATARAKLQDPHVLCAEQVLTLHAEIIAFAREQFRKDLRVSSLLEKQPPSIDSHIDDFAVEAQARGGVGIGGVCVRVRVYLHSVRTLAPSAGSDDYAPLTTVVCAWQSFTNGLTNAVSFAALAASIGLTVQLFGGDTSTISLSLILGFLGPWSAIATIVNVSRYKNRNEDWRVQFADEKLLPLLQSVYAHMGPTERRAVDVASNPVVKVVTMKYMLLIRDVSYYDYDEPAEFKASYAAMMDDYDEPGAIRAFMTAICTKYIVDPQYYCVDSFLQAARPGCTPPQLGRLSRLYPPYS